MRGIDHDATFETYLRDADALFAGWDFSYLSRAERMQTSPWAWSYGSLVIPLARNASALLDMGTGGGEFLASLQPLPPVTVATEGFAPNVPLARERLEPLGARVVEVDDDGQLPLEDGTFDLVINRHESYDPAEVLRVLRPGGTFITQQVGGEDDLDLNRLLGADATHPYAHWTATHASDELRAVGFELLHQREAFPFTRFYDVGAIAYYLKAVPWQIPDFSVERYRDQLRALHDRLVAEGYVDIRNHRFLLIARKPGG